MYGGDPPCDECDYVELMPENERAWELWQLLNAHDRPIGLEGIRQIPTMTITNICDRYNELPEIFDKIMVLEEVIFPLLREQVKQHNEARKAQIGQHKKHRGRQWR